MPAEPANKPAAIATPSYWSVVPVMLKPDSLIGERASVDGGLAADYGVFFAAALDDLSLPDRYAPRCLGSTAAAIAAARHAKNEMDEITWYASLVQRKEECQRNLRAVAQCWGQEPRVSVSGVIENSIRALGFRIVSTCERTLRVDDYKAMYGDTRRTAEVSAGLQESLVGKVARMLLLCGHQENSALQLLKIYLRYILGGASANNRVRNWFHVTNPNAAFYAECIAMCTGVPFCLVDGTS